MKGKVKVTHVDRNALELDSKKYYKTSFIDEDGLAGVFYSQKVHSFGDDITVELVSNGERYKFKEVKA